MTLNRFFVRQQQAERMCDGVEVTHTYVYSQWATRDLHLGPLCEYVKLNVVSMYDTIMPKHPLDKLTCHRCIATLVGLPPIREGV